jgi:hypothetical protein
MTKHADHQPAIRSLRADLTHLTLEPFVVGDDETRQGRRAVITLTTEAAAAQDIVTVSVSIFLLNLPLPTEMEAGADAVEVAAAVEDLADSDVCVRMAACQRLGQIGGAQVIELLERALRDESAEVRDVAARSLRISRVPRLAQSDLASMWDQVEVVVDGKKAAFMGHGNRSRAVIRGVRPHALCRVHVSQIGRMAMAAALQEDRADSWFLTDDELDVVVSIRQIHDGFQIVAASPEPLRASLEHWKLAVLVTNRTTGETLETLPIRPLARREQAPEILKEFGLTKFADTPCWFRFEEYRFDPAGEFVFTLAH